MHDLGGVLSTVYNPSSTQPINYSEKYGEFWSHKSDQRKSIKKTAFGSQLKQHSHMCALTLHLDKRINYSVNLIINGTQKIGPNKKQLEVNWKNTHARIECINVTRTIEKEKEKKQETATTQNIHAYILQAEKPEKKGRRNERPLAYLF